MSLMEQQHQMKNYQRKKHQFSQFIQSAMILVQIVGDYVMWSEVKLSSAKQTKKFCKKILYLQLQWKYIVCFITLFLGLILWDWFQDRPVNQFTAAFIASSKTNRFRIKWQSICCKFFKSCQFMESGSRAAILENIDYSYDSAWWLYHCLSHPVKTSIMNKLKKECQKPK